MGSELMEQNGLFEAEASGRFVRVVPECAFEQCLDYAVPESWSEQVSLGHRLRIPWGKSETFAYVVGFPDRPEVDSCRMAIERVDDEPLIPPSLIRLGQWMAGYYCSELTQVLKAMLPELLRRRSRGFKDQLWVSLTEVSGEEIKLPASAKAQKRALQALRGVKAGWLVALCRDTGTTPATWRALEKRGVVKLETKAKHRNPFRNDAQSNEKPLILTDEQERALSILEAELKAPSPRPVLLHGVTGSGKTEIYLRLIQRVLSEGKRALVLVPEISLTPQTVFRFRRRFENRGIGLAVLHSHLSAGERHDQWHRIRSGEARIVIGVRSAVFAPLEDIGVIIVDEEHEQSFKQEESPRYHARDLAVLRGGWEKALVVLGSATPSLESIQNVRDGKYHSARLIRRTDSSRLPVVHVVDLRKEKRGGRDAFQISTPLQSAIRDRLEKGEQTILFLNRRGFSTSLQCPKCGYVAQCPACSVPMTYHRTDSDLRCHLCDHLEELPAVCPECQFREFKFGGMGTQKIEDTVARMFPSARWQRMDSDSMRGKDAYENALASFRAGELDILIGTQMITKGLDFPNVTCVGIINVDGALQMPDFRAAERVLAQLVQVAGRAGRGTRLGEVFLQTFTPFHPTIQFARHHDVCGFIDHELEFRDSQNFPPFYRCAVIGIRGRDLSKTAFCADQVTKLLSGLAGPETRITAAAPAPIEKMRNQFRFQVVCFTRNMPRLSRGLSSHLVGQRWPEGVRVSIDIDAFHLL